MANRLTHIVDAIRTKDYAVATESIAQVLQQKVEQSLAQERQRVAGALVREGYITEMPALYDVQDDEEGFFINARSFGGPERFYTFSRLKAAGIPQEAMRACYSPYENLQGFAVKKKYAKKAAKVLNLESVTSPALAKFSAEDSSGGRATPGKCAKCGKPATWYHNRLDKKFCADCAPNDTMSRIQESRQLHESARTKETYVDLVRTLTDPDYDGESDDPDIEDVIAQARTDHGSKFAQDLETGIDKMHFPRTGVKWGLDTYWSRIAPRINKSGITNKQDVKALKNQIRQTVSGGAYKRRNLPEASEGHYSGQGWPTKERAEEAAEKVRKYDDREITVVKVGQWWKIHYGPELSEAFKEEKQKMLCHDCGNVFMSAGLPAKCPECGCRKCIETDEPVSEGCGKLHESEAENCERCGKWSGQSTLCSACKGKAKAEWDAPVPEKKKAAIEKSLKKHGLREDKCSQCGTDRNPVDSLLGDVCGKCARDNHKKATGKK